MYKNILTEQILLENTVNHIHIHFPAPRKVISSAVMNGGIVHAEHIVNMKVSKHSKCNKNPELSIAEYCADKNWNGTAVGMMTAASMDSFRMTEESAHGVYITVLVTSGLSNPRRAGDYAECREITVSKHINAGTINIIAMTSAGLTDTAMVEAVMIISEAKAAVLQEAEVISPASGKTATGTGTDAIAVVSGNGAETVRYCGKHVLFGEMLGRSVIDAVKSSINWYFMQQKN